MNTLAIQLDAKATYEVIDNLEIQAGVNLGFDVLKSVTASGSVGNHSGNGSQSLLENAFGMQWGLNVGCAYKF